MVSQMYVWMDGWKDGWMDGWCKFEIVFLVSQME